MWSPADSLDWQKDSSCSEPKNKDKVKLFFSSDPNDKYEAKNLCFSCPVRKECLQWALEHRQIWGIWGGKDDFDIRRTLSVSGEGEEVKRRRSPNCPYCSARPAKLTTQVVDTPGGGRWTTAKIVICTECNFSWRSRTSANAVNSYHESSLEKSKKRKEVREYKKAIELERLSKIEDSSEVSDL